MKRLIVFSVLFVGQWLLADSVVWAKLIPKYSYQDIDMSCSDKTVPLNNFFFMARLNAAGNIIQAEIRDGDLYYLKRIVLTEEEFSGIKTSTDAIGELWLKTLPFSTRLIGWLIYNVGEGDPPQLGCRPLHKLATIAPGSTVFEFTPKDAGVYISPRRTFEGARADGKAYTVTMGFSQTALEIP